LESEWRWNVAYYGLSHSLVALAAWKDFGGPESSYLLVGFKGGYLAGWARYTGVMNDPTFQPFPDTFFSPDGSHFPHGTLVFPDHPP
jgi:hypothetical protein